MSEMKRITTRELLRNFKNLKELLLQRKVHLLLIDIDGDNQLELTMHKQSNTAENLARVTRQIKKPMDIKRSDLFEELLS